MRSCVHCGHANADHLPYCAACGKRLRPLGAGAETPAPQLEPRLQPAAAAANGSSGFAATVALGPSRPATVSAATALAPVLVPPSAWVQVRDAMSYVFATIRGRIDAEEQRRTLIGEREGARRMAESTLVELGHAVLVQGIEAPALRELTEAAARLKKRREAVAADLAAAEKFQAAEDLRLGLLEAAVEGECNAYEQSVGEVEQTLARHATERQAADEAAQDGGALTPRTAASPGEKLDDQQRALRDRAAALRASSMAARARLEQAAAARRRSAAAIAASVAGHSRERAAIEEEGRSLTERIGARALALRLPSPHLLPGYERYDRLQETIRTEDTELARLERSKGGLDRRKLALGLGLIGASLGVMGAGLWALLR